MWGFCSAYVWDKVSEFMVAEKFTNTLMTKDQWAQRIFGAVTVMSLQQNPQGQLCVLNVLTKAKSLHTQKWVF